MVSYSLFNEHQIIFSFLLATAIMRNNERYHDKWRGLGALTDHHWNVFLHTRALTGMTDAETLVGYVCARKSIPKVYHVSSDSTVKHVIALNLQTVVTKNCIYVGLLLHCEKICNIS